MEKDLVSIIVPIYNTGKIIYETIDSVKNQTYTNWELILVNDCSTDDTNKYLESIEDSRIRVINLEKNQGAAIARNTGIDIARGKYIAFLDADDLWVREKLEKQINFMKQNNYAFTFSGYEFANERGIGTGKVVHVPHKINYKQALKNTTISTCAVILDVEKLGKDLIKMPNIRRGQDTATWWKILKAGNEAYGLDESLFLYRRSNNTLSSNKIKALKRTWNLYRKVEKLSIFKSVYFFSCYVLNAIKRRV